MPKGPQGQQRPADVIGNAVYIAQIATGEIEETTLNNQPSVRAGAKARVESTTRAERSSIASIAAKARWE